MKGEGGRGKWLDKTKLHLSLYANMRRLVGRHALCQNLVCRRPKRLEISFMA